MEKARVGIKEMSILILIFSALSFVRTVISAFFTDLNLENLPEGATAGIVLGAQIAICVLALLLLWPQIYVGVKGIKVSKNPDSSKAHIVWATILAILSIIGLISPIYEIVNNVNLVDNLFELADMAIDVIIFVVYIKFAKQICKAA